MILVNTAATGNGMNWYFVLWSEINLDREGMTMKNTKSILALCLALCCLFSACAALAENSRVAYVHNPDPADRLNLRQAADQHALSLGRYYNGTAVEILSEAGEWATVRIGTLEGYMMRKYLTGEMVASAMPVYRSLSSAWELYEKPDRSSGHTMHGAGKKVTLMGFSRQWWHVRIGDETGFVPAGSRAFEQVSGVSSDGYLLATVSNPNPEDRLHLRLQPGAESPSLGKYYNGCSVTVLGPTDGGSNWYHVRIGTLEGYMDGRYLAFDRIAAPAMPAYLSTSSAWEVYLNPDLHSEYRMHGAGEPVVLLGFSEKWWHIRAGSDIGFVPAEPGCLKPAQSSAPETSVITVAVVHNPDPADRLNLRRKASPSAGSLGKYYNGCPVAVLEAVDNHWFRVRIGHLEGYMDGTYLDFDASIAHAAEQLPMATIRITAGQEAPLTETAAPASPVYATYPSGTQVQVLGVGEGWCHVSVNGSVGFMQTALLEPPMRFGD